jgi:hypothetical protein
MAQHVRAARLSDLDAVHERAVAVLARIDAGTRRPAVRDSAQPPWAS